MAAVVVWLTLIPNHQIWMWLILLLQMMPHVPTLLTWVIRFILQLLIQPALLKSAPALPIWLFLAAMPATAFADTIVFDLAPTPDDSAMAFGWRIPDSIFAGADDIAAGFYWLHVTAQDVAGNSVEDSILLPYAIDTEKPSFDGDSVWVELYYDANEDGIAAVGDTVSINAWMTGNPIGEVSTVTTDMTNWGYGSAIALDDQSGDRKFIKLLELTAGALDLDASDSGSVFYVTATDNACNSVTDSNLANFAIDNEIPAAPTITYVRQYDHDTNNKININDSIKVTVDASTTSDLATTCEVMGDFWLNGLGGSQTQCIEDTTVAGVYTFTTLVVYGGIHAVDVGTNVHTVEITLTDDAGNMETFTSPAIIYPVDTDPPSAVANLEADRGACAIDLDWDDVSSDDSVYVIFWDGGDGWSASDTARDADGNLVFLDTLGSTTSTSWTTDGTVTLTHGTTYQFVVRTIDDANNREYNFNRVSEIADCEAPIACVTQPASGGAYGSGNDLDIIAESEDADIDGATLFVRDADQGTGTPGPWVSFGSMSNPGSGGVFTMTIDSADMAGFGCVNDSYELIVTAADEVGNAQSISDAIADCGIFAFDWFCLSLPVELISVNDTVSPQTSCGFNVVRGPDNTIEMNVTNFTAGDTYTVDVYVINDWEYTRVWYTEDVDAMPYSFDLDCTDWPKGTQDVWIEVTHNTSGNMGTLAVEVCVPDEDAPMAYMTVPHDGIYVMKTCNFGYEYTVTAEIWDDTYDPDNVTKVEFEESTDGETWTVFDVVTTGSGGEYDGSWDNCAYDGGDVVWLRATFYDDYDNTFTTPPISVTIDDTWPDVSLEVLDATTDACGNDIISDMVELRATVNTTWEDIDEVYFVYSPLDSPDIAGFYRLIDTGDPANNTNVYTATLYTDSLVDGWSYRFRVIARDIDGNTMYDSDGDGNMDDYTFDAVNNGSDAIFKVDNSVPDVVFGNAKVYDGATLVNEFPTPSEQLNGAGRIYAKKGYDITVQGWPLPMDDTCCIREVYYLWDDEIIGRSSDLASMFEFTFNPFEMGLIDELDIEDGYVDEELSVGVVDCMGNFSVDETDAIDVYILDVDNEGVVWYYPEVDACVAGVVELGVLAIDDASTAYVNFYYRSPGGDWNFIGSSADVIVTVAGFGYFWSTYELADGTYELGAIPFDPSDNEGPVAIREVTVANTAPTVTITAPADLAYIAYETIVTADVTGGSPGERVQFQYKAQTDDDWDQFSVDFYEPYAAPFDGDSDDGWYDIRVRAQNCADVWGISDNVTVFLDNTDPRARLTSVAGIDAGANDGDIDVTGMSTIAVTGYFADDKNEIANSGLAMVGFRLMDYDEYMVDEIRIDPATAGFHTVHFDISGLGYGEYYLEAYAVDAVGNYESTQEVTIYFDDHSAPTVAIAGYFDGVLYGYDWSGDAEYVLFQRWDTELEEWVGIAYAEESTSHLWSAPWWPEAGTYTLRVVATDDDGNYDDDGALTATFNYTDEMTFDFGTTDITLVATKNNSTCNGDGIVKVESPLGRPKVIGVYDWGNDTEYISLDENQQTDGMYLGSFDAGDMDDYSASIIFASYPNAAGTAIEIGATGFITHEILPDFGTNGYVQALDSMVQLTVPGNATDDYLTALIMETWIPEAGIDQDHFNVIGIGDGNGWYIGCIDCYEGSKASGGEGESDLSLGESSGGCCFNENTFAKIRMPYDSENTTPAESLAVAWWDPYDNEWNFDGIYYPTFVEGFNTDDHYVEFASDCLYGLYAVVSYRTPSHEGPIAIEWIDYGWCGYYDPWPTLKLQVWDQTINNSDIDEDTWQMWVDGIPIVEDGESGDAITYDYDPITNILYVSSYGWWWWEDYFDEDSSWSYADALDCGTHTFKIGVKNMQGQYSEKSFDFDVDCEAPHVVFENSYVSKNPTIQFYVTDDLSGVDESSIHVDVVAIQSNNTNADDPHQDETLFFLQTFFPEQITIGEEGLVTIPTTYDLEDERAIVVVIYDGYKTTSESYGDPVDWGYDNGWSEYYTDSHGIYDCVGNNTTPVVQILTIDVEAPTIWVVGYDTPGSEVLALPGICPVQIQVQDDGDGFEANDLTIFEDGEAIERVAPDEVEEGTYSFNTTTGMVSYCPTPGAKVEITVTDGAGNTATRFFGSGDPGTIVDASLNMNPWDPAVDGPLTIDFGYTGPATVKIYDFAGDLVWASNPVTNGTVMWYGGTQDGTMVADGVYFGYVEVTTDGGVVSTVVKIAVVEK